jgi:hypothetical protein
VQDIPAWQSEQRKTIGQEHFDLRILIHMRRRPRSLPCVALALGICLFVAPFLFAQEREEPPADAIPVVPASAVPPAESAASPLLPSAPEAAPESDPPKDDRLLYTLPNFLTVEGNAAAPRLTSGQKFKLVAKDSFDIAEYPFLGFQAAIAQASNTPPEFRQGIPGYARRYGAAFADNTIGNFMTEGIFPSLLRQDPRYYQRGSGSFLRRFVYTVSRSVITRSDSGRAQFNYSEFAGNAVAAGISNLYYPQEDRTLRNTAVVWGTQIGWDTAANLLREFWPDLHRAIHRKKTA